MNLFTETVIISALMLMLCGLPLLSTRVRNYSKLCFLLGTGALLGLCIFDLLPDLFEMGGHASLWQMGAIWAAYSAFHIWHLRRHDGPHDHGAAGHYHHAHHENTGLFLASMISHCFASGILLVVSQDLNRGVGRTVFFALLAHKGYEALTVSTVLLEKQKSRFKALLSVGLYSLALPLGVGVTVAFHRSITPAIALFATSLAVGSLLGCLIFDFLLPSVSQIRARRVNIVWVFAGFFLTQLVMRLV